MKQTRSFWLTLCALILVLVTLACAQTNTFAVLNLAQTWTAIQTFSSGLIISGTAITTETGTGALVRANTPTLITPNIGASTGTSLNLGGTGTLSTTATSGTGSICLNISCSMTTPNVGAALGTSLNLGSTGVLSTTAQSGTGSLCMTVTCLMTTPNIGDANGSTLILSGLLTTDTATWGSSTGTLDTTGQFWKNGFLVRGRNAANTVNVDLIRWRTNNTLQLAGGFGAMGIGINATAPVMTLEVDGGVMLKTATAKSTCDSTIRGTFWVVRSTAGVKDTVEVCAKDAADVYAWRTIY